MHILKQFDPFCRRDRIQFNYGKDKYIITTVGQLNFFRWAIENKVLDYIKQQCDPYKDEIPSVPDEIVNKIENVYSTYNLMLTNKELTDTSYAWNSYGGRVNSNNIYFL